MDSQLRIIVIGGGWVTENRHLPALRKERRILLQSVISKNVDRAEFLKKKFSAKTYFGGDGVDFSQVLQGCDAVVIGSDPFSHYEIAKQAIALGKHVLMEKPLTLSVVESAELVGLAKEKKIRFAVVHNFQFSQSASALKEDIEKGKLGEIRSLEAKQYSNEKRRLPVWYEDLPWGLFYDESPHLLYLLEMVGGKQSLQHSQVLFRSGVTTPVLVEGLLIGETGIPSVLSMNFSASLSEWFLIVHGSKRTGILDIFRDTYFSLPNDGKHTPKDIFRTSWLVFFGHFTGVVKSGIKVLRGGYLCGNEEVVKRFVDAVLDNRPLGTLDAENGLRINALQHEIMERSFHL